MGAVLEKGGLAETPLQVDPRRKDFLAKKKIWEIENFGVR